MKSLSLFQMKNIVRNRKIKLLNCYYHFRRQELRLSERDTLSTINNIFESTWSTVNIGFLQQEQIVVQSLLEPWHCEFP